MYVKYLFTIDEKREAWGEGLWVYEPDYVEIYIKDVFFTIIRDDEKFLQASATLDNFHPLHNGHGHIYMTYRKKEYISFIEILCSCSKVSDYINSFDPV